MTLFDAAKVGNVAELQSQIMAGGCDLQQRDHNGRTILHIAIQYGQCEFIKALGQHLSSQDLHMASYRNTNAATFAVSHDQPDALEALFKIGFDLSRPDESGLTPATKAAFDNKVEIIRLLHRKGVDLSVKDNFHPGKAPVHWAAEYGNVDIIHALQELGIPLDPPVNLYDMTPLCLAAEFNQFDAVKALLDYGVDINKHGAHNRTPLMCAALSGSGDILKLLLDGGANINLLDRSQQSALHHAASRKHINCVECLLTRTLDINAKNLLGYTPLHLALQNGGDINLAELLLENKADVNAISAQGFTSLHCALLGKCEINVIEFLLSKGVDINKCQMTSTGEWLSAITSAIQGHHAKIIPFLYRNGASIDKLNDDDILFLLEKAEELFNEKHAAPPLELMRLALQLWPTLPLDGDEIIDPTLLPYRLKIQQQLADEQTSLKLIDQSLRHDPHSFFGYIPKDVYEYVIKPMVEDFSVDPRMPLAFDPADYCPAEEVTIFEGQHISMPKSILPDEDDLCVVTPNFGN